MTTTRVWIWILLACAALAPCTPGSLDAQVFRGRVLDQLDDHPIPTALVRLIGEDGQQRALAIADSAGVYTLRAPEPGIYRLEAARLGYENFSTPPLAAANPDGVYPIDLLLRAAPLEIAGIAVRARRLTEEQADRLLRREIGRSPASLRYRPLGFDDITSHVDRGHNLVDVVRWGNYAGMVVRFDLSGWCFEFRGRCLEVFLNGMPLLRDFVESIPLDMVHTIAVVTPNDASLMYPAGALLLFTESLMR
jgi:hypothetical protein